ncbi:MAG TPA: redoxin family protein [Syntrophales bacterium]|nr:redoxin family protein [Syntrophales bacterium]
MKRKTIRLFLLSLSLLFLSACAAVYANIPTEEGSVAPGSAVAREGMPLKLLGKPIAIGDKLPSVELVDAMTMQRVDLARDMKGSVLFLSIVPSLDTKVCEAQTHYLYDHRDKLPPEVKIITISRDTPFAQKRFADEARIKGIEFLSDYKEGAFGRSTGLLMEGLMLLARSVIIVDKNGKVRYIQVVPEITHLPDMERAIQEAQALVK